MRSTDYRRTPPIPPGFGLGDLVPAINRVTSKTEESVRASLRNAGYKIPLAKVAILCQPPDRSSLLRITPDIVLKEHLIAIEVDPCEQSQSHGHTHFGEEDKDRARNLLMGHAGWLVIRLRLGAQLSQQIGDRDVVVESSGFTQAAQAALLAALQDAIQNRPTEVRLVPKGPTRAAPQRKSHVQRIGPNRYSDNGHFFSWYPSLDGNQKHVMCLSLGGRYLYTRDSRFVSEVGLDLLPSASWLGQLEQELAAATHNSMGSTKWPWGDVLFVCAPGDKDGEEVVLAGERKATIDDQTAVFTVGCPSLARWDSEGLYREGESPVAQLHPGAIAIGYRIAEVELHDGRYGPYRKIAVQRPAVRPSTSSSAAADSPADSQ